MSIALFTAIYKKLSDFISRKYLVAFNISENLDVPENDQFKIYFKNNKLVYLNSLGVELEVSNKISEASIIGSIINYAGNDLPLGYLRCDGSTFNTLKYAELFRVLNSNILPLLDSLEYKILIKAQNVFSNGTSILASNGIESNFNSTNNTLHIYTYNKYNYVINGDFKVNQRGNTFNNVNEKFISDRFFLEYSKEKSNLFLNKTSIKSFIPGELIGANLNSNTYLNISQTQIDQNKTSLCLSQKIENVSVLAGQKITLSFFAKCDSIQSIGIKFVQNFGDFGSKENSIQVSNLVVGTLWERKVITVDLPSILNKRIGENSYFSICVLLPVNSIFSFDISYVQLEVGNFSSSLHRSYQEELALCQRFYEIQTIETLTDLSILKNVKTFKVKKRKFPKIEVIQGNLDLARFDKVYLDSNLHGLNLEAYCQVNPARNSSIATIGFNSEL